MPQRRLRWLFAAMVALALLRWLVPPNAEAPPALSEAVPRHVPLAPEPAGESAATANVLQLPEVAEAQDLVALAGNPFAVRGSLTPPPVLASATARTAPPPEPPPAPAPSEPPMPALQVIGTWSDEQGLAVFVATSNGALMVRPGTVLMGEFTVVRVTPQTLSLRHGPTNRDLELSVPRQPRS